MLRSSEVPGGGGEPPRWRWRASRSRGPGPGPRSMRRRRRGRVAPRTRSASVLRARRSPRSPARRSAGRRVGRTGARGCRRSTRCSAISIWRACRRSARRALGVVLKSISDAHFSTRDRPKTGSRVPITTPPSTWAPWTIGPNGSAASPAGPCRGPTHRPRAGRPVVGQGPRSARSRSARTGSREGGTRREAGSHRRRSRRGSAHHRRGRTPRQPRSRSPAGYTTRCRSPARPPPAHAPAASFATAPASTPFTRDTRARSVSISWIRVTSTIWPHTDGLPPASAAVHRGSRTPAPDRHGRNAGTGRPRRLT